MNGCANWRDSVADSALGIVQGAAFAAHLAGCPDCAEALRESQTAAVRMNAALDRRATIEPPSYGPDRVMARIAGSDLVRTSLWWGWALVACVIAVLIASVLWIRRPTPQPSVSALASWHSPTEVLLQPPVGTAWITMPRLGEGLFELKPSEEKHAQ
jgi:anti-sigma factor RsiW